jgi:hypothetical protein
MKQESQPGHAAWMDKYVARCVTWDWHDGSHIDLFDDDGKVARTLDASQTWIFHEADGGRTVKNLLEWSAAHYRDGHQPPSDLDEANLRSLAELVERFKAVALRVEAPVLDERFLLPRSKWPDAA